MSASPFLTDCGLNGIHWVPYGLHACHWYDGREDLADSLVAYFLAGLYLGERCLWLTAPPLPVTEARAALRATWPECETVLSVGALEIVDFSSWYGAGGFDPEKLVERLLREEERALAEGYRGLRLSGNTAGLQPDEHAAFHRYERTLSERLGERRILALCSHDRHTSRDRAREVEEAHHCTFEQAGEGWWQVRRAPGQEVGAR